MRWFYCDGVKSKGGLSPVGVFVIELYSLELLLILILVKLSFGL